MAETPAGETVVDVVSHIAERNVADLTPAIRPASALVLPAASTAEIEEAFAAYQALGRALLDDSDYQGIEGKKFLKRSGLRKLATAFGVSFRIEDREHTVDDLGRVVRSEFIVTATAPNGRFAQGYGACGVWDRCQNHGAWKSCTDGKCKHCGGREGGCDGFHHYSKPEHDVPATAETRAKNRAASDLFGMGEVSAEEVDSKDPANQRASRDQVDDLIAAAKALKTAGGDPGKWPVVLGITVVERAVDPADGEVHTSILITAEAATTLLEQLVARTAAVNIDGGEAGPAPESTGQDQPGSGGEAAGPVSPPVEQPAAPEGKADHPAEGPEGAAVAQPSTEDVEQPVLGDAVAGAEGGGSSAVETPTAPDTEAPVAPTAPPEPSSTGERTRLARGLKAIYGDDNGDLARGALIQIVTEGRTRKSTEGTTSAEIKLAIKASKLLGSGHLAFAVIEDGDECDLPPAAVPAENEVPTLVAVVPEGAPEGDRQGEVFLNELVDSWGK